jgi:hypothetical protein
LNSQYFYFYKTDPAGKSALSVFQITFVGLLRLQNYFLRLLKLHSLSVD